MLNKYSMGVHRNRSEKPFSNITLCHMSNSRLIVGGSSDCWSPWSYVLMWDLTGCKAYFFSFCIILKGCHICLVDRCYCFVTYFMSHDIKNASIEKKSIDQFNNGDLYLDIFYKPLDNATAIHHIIIIPFTTSKGFSKREVLKLVSLSNVNDWLVFLKHNSEF